MRRAYNLEMRWEMRWEVVVVGGGEEVERSFDSVCA